MDGGQWLSMFSQKAKVLSEALSVAQYGHIEDKGQYSSIQVLQIRFRLSLTVNIRHFREK